MSMLPAASLGSPRRAPAILNQEDRDRERALVLIFAMAALAAGALAAVASYAVLAFAVGLLLIVLAAWTLPLTWLGPVLAALIPFQLYFPIPATSFTLRAALVFVFAVAVRMAVDRHAFSFVFRLELALSPSTALGVNSVEGSFVRGFAWLLPAGLFLLAAFVAALGALDRYAAFKGIYDWLGVFLTAFMVAALAPSASMVRCILSVLIVGGVAQALLGLLQHALGLNTILELLRLPVSGLLYQPNLLKDKLEDLSFNWVAFDRALPFGTFINGIDYAVFLAAILSLIIALVITREQPSAVNSQRSLMALSIGAVLIAIALLLTFKGSGLLALIGGLAAIALVSLSRLSGRTVTVGLVVLAGGLVLALPFADLIGQRALFLIQREQGSLGTIGRLQIWTNLLQFVADRPVFGYGFNNVIALTAPQWTLRDGAPGFVFPAPESSYVSALVETGLVGFAALTAWLLAAVARGYRRARDESQATLALGMVAALVALLCGNFTVSALTTDQNGMLLGILIGLIYGSQYGLQYGSQKDDGEQV